MNKNSGGSLSFYRLLILVGDPRKNQARIGGKVCGELRKAGFWINGCGKDALEKVARQYPSVYFGAIDFA